MKKKWLVRVLVGCLWFLSIVYSYGLGGLAGMYKPENVEITSRMALKLLMLFVPTPCTEEDTTVCGYQDIENRVAVDCSIFSGGSERKAVLFTFGQSNSANSGKGSYSARYDVANFNPHDGKCYKAEDPLLGPDGEGGAVWGRVGDKLIESGDYDQVLVVPFGIGGTNIARWIPGGDLHARVEHAANAVLGQNILPSHVLWHQGEADAGDEKSAAEYTKMFGQLVQSLRTYGIDAPVLPAVATRCGNDGSEALRKAQLSLADHIENVYTGANTDLLTQSGFRFDDCHFSEAGLNAHAELWLQSIQNVDNSR